MEAGFLIGCMTRSIIIIGCMARSTFSCYSYKSRSTSALYHWWLLYKEAVLLLLLSSLLLLASLRLLDSRLPRHTCCCGVRDLCVVYATAVGPAVAFAAVGDPGVQLVSFLLIAFLLLLVLLLLMTLVCCFLQTWRPCSCWPAWCSWHLCCSWHHCGIPAF